MTRFWRHLLQREASTRSSALLRIGIVLLLWTRFARDLLLFHHPDDPARWVLSFAFFITTTLVLVGYQTRITSVLLAVVMWWMYAGWGFYGGATGWLHHHTYLLIAAATWLVFLPSGRSFSLDRWLEIRRAQQRGISPAPEVGPVWGLSLMAAQVSAVYLFSAIDKTNAFFLSGDSLIAVFQHFYTGSDPITLPGFATLCQGLAITTVVLEYLLPVALFVRRWQIWLVPVGLLFHGILYMMLPVGTFTATMWVLYLAYLDPDDVDRFLYSMTMSAKSTINDS